MKKYTVPLIVLILYLVLILVKLNAFGFDAGVFINAGDRYTDTKDIPVTAESDGYDGQFFYRLALDPFTNETKDYGVKLDNPPYRHQRILYPFLTWLLSFGITSLVPWALLFINLAALVVMSYFLSQKYGLWSLAIMVYPGFILTLIKDLSEIMAVMFVVIGLYYLKKNELIASVMLSLAVLTKETTLLVGVCALGYSIYKKKKWWYFSIPIIVFLSFQAWLYHVWGMVPVLAGGGNMGIPFGGIIEFVKSTNNFGFLEMLFITYFGLVTTYNLFYFRKECVIRISFILYSILIICLTYFVWIQDWSFFRALTEWFVLGMLILIGNRSKHLLPLCTIMMYIWIELFLNRF
ncbi:hypothetical protein K9M79_05460 [Candidatus Woesearchaeota archaeon]|nr:hypothetical protein [Candidatus Woesearchaeota archaeon]